MKCGGYGRFYLDEPSKHIVATGRVFKVGSKLHSRTLLDNQIKVLVDKVIDKEAKLPIHYEEAETVGEALSHFIAWPKKLVELCSTSDVPDEMDKQSIAQKSPVMHGIDPHKLTAECKQLYCIVKGLTRDVTLRLSDEIFMIKDYDLFILREEMLRFLAMETIDASSILFFMWSLVLKVIQKRKLII
nr:putative transcription factor Trihelix family [Ipomoea batatas]